MEIICLEETEFQIVLYISVSSTGNVKFRAAIAQSLT